MYVLDPLFNIKTADRDLDEIHSMASQLFSRLDEVKKKVDAKGKSKADPDLAIKVKEGLKNKKYKDDASGKDISFGTAYARGNAQAKSDFNKEMSNAKKEKETETDLKSKPGGKDQDDKKSIAKKINEIDTKKDLNPRAILILKALRGRDSNKAKNILEEIEQGAERGVVDALIQILSSPELQQVLGGAVQSDVSQTTDTSTPSSKSKATIPTSQTVQPKPSSQDQGGNKSTPSKSKIPAEGQIPEQDQQGKMPSSKTPSGKSTTQTLSQSKGKTPAQPIVQTPKKPSSQGKPSTQAPAKSKTTPKAKPQVPDTTQAPDVTQTPPPVVETGMSAKPKLDMARVSKWIKARNLPFDAKNFEKHLKTMDVDLDDNELDAFMTSYTSTVKKKQNHDDYKKYRDVDLNTIKNPKELARAMAIKKESEYYFNPLNGLGLDEIKEIKDLEEHKNELRDTQLKRYSRMPAEDRKEMGDKLQAEIAKLDPKKDKEKIAILESAYDGLLASAMFQDNEEEMKELFDVDPTEKMNDAEKEEYNKKKTEQRKQKRDIRKKEIGKLDKILNSRTLDTKESEKRKQNEKKIEDLKPKTKEMSVKIKELEKQIKEETDEDKLEKLKALLEKQKNSKSNLEKEISSLEDENHIFDLKDPSIAESNIKQYEDIKDELETLRVKLLSSQSDTNADKKELKKDQIAYKKLVEIKEKAKKSQYVLNERAKKQNQLEKLKEIDAQENLIDEVPMLQSQVVADEEKLQGVVSEINDLKQKTSKTPDEEQKLKDLENHYNNEQKRIEKTKKELQAKNEKLDKSKKPKSNRFSVDKNIIALAQTINSPKTLKALMQMTKAKDQGTYKENLKTIFENVTDTDLIGVVENSSISPMAKLLSPDFCPENVSGQTKSYMSYDDDDKGKCKITLDNKRKQEIREHIIDMISNEMFFTNADKGKTKQVSISTTEEEQNDVTDTNTFDREKEKEQEKAKELQREKEKEEKEKQKKHQEDMKKYTEGFVDVLKISDAKKREEKIREITTELSLARASDATRDEKSKAMIEAIRKIPDPKKKQEYLELLQKNDSDPPLFKKIQRLGNENFNKVFINNNNNNKGLDFNMKKKSTTITNYQEIASNFKIGMKVFPFYGGSKDHHGTVVAIYPAIGMVDVQFPFGSARYPVEDLQIADLEIEPVKYDSVPGGLGTKPVNAKTALYWADKDRKYRMCRNENKPTCPRCKNIELKKTIYKRIGGRSERLLCCPECLFLIKTTDILGFNN